MELEVIFAINRYFNSIDDHDFEISLDSFCEEFDADYTSMVGGEPMKNLPRAVNMHAWKGMLAGFDSTQHIVGNHVVSVDEVSKTAQVRLKGMATHVMKREGLPDELWQTGGNYFLTMLKSSDDNKWRIRTIKYAQSWKVGSEKLMQEAAMICAAREAKAADEASPAPSSTP